MTSIPRDSYVEIPCYNNMKDKLTMPIMVEQLCD
ncbi:MAG: hypothetical protein ACLRQF_22680 [Thomasclavelia ramosa]